MVSELLAGFQIAPLAGRQVAEHDLADADAFQADNLQADLLAHPANLALFTFLENETELILVLPPDPRRL